MAAPLNRLTYNRIKCKNNKKYIWWLTQNLFARETVGAVSRLFGQKDRIS